MVRVKICGVTSVEDARLAVRCGAAAIGLNFYPASPRYVEREQAMRIREAVPAGVCCVGVFVNAARSLVEEAVLGLRLDALQFHGHETEDDIRGWKVKVIRAFRLRGRDLPADVLRCSADYLLFDAYREGMYGGTGRPFAWDVLRGLPTSRLILAGGLDPENVEAAVRAVRPFAVDVAGGVESAPGRKDAAKLEAFIAHAQAA